MCVASRVRGGGDGMVDPRRARRGRAALDAATGAARGERGSTATRVGRRRPRSAAAPDGGCIVGGTFSGTARRGARGAPKIVSAASRSDGFVARLDRRRRRSRGSCASAGWAPTRCQASRRRGERVAVAGTFTAGAELGGVELPRVRRDVAARRRRSSRSSTSRPARARGRTTFGGKADDAVAGVAIDATGRVSRSPRPRATPCTSADAGPRRARRGRRARRVVVGPTARRRRRRSSAAPTSTACAAIVAVGDRAVVAGFFSGAMTLGAQRLVAGGGDDAFVAEIDASGVIAHALGRSPAPGREERRRARGAARRVRRSASRTPRRATIDGVAVPAPADPLAGAAIAVRAGY